MSLYSKTPMLKPPFRLLGSGLISEIQKYKENQIWDGKMVLNSGVV